MVIMSLEEKLKEAEEKLSVMGEINEVEVKRTEQSEASRETGHKH